MNFKRLLKCVHLFAMPAIDRSERKKSPQTLNPFLSLAGCIPFSIASCNTLDKCFISKLTPPFSIRQFNTAFFQALLRGLNIATSADCVIRVVLWYNAIKRYRQSLPPYGKSGHSTGNFTFFLRTWG